MLIPSKYSKFINALSSSSSKNAASLTLHPNILSNRLLLIITWSTLFHAPLYLYVPFAPLSPVAFAETLPEVSRMDALQQSDACTGVVKDALGESVIGASVIVKGTTNGSITDLDGNFTIMGVKKGDIIQISYVGYVTQEIVWDGSPLNVILKEDTQTLDEVVVTGYGGQQKRATLTTAISKMDDSVLENAAISNAGQALQGTVTGLRVINTTGQPGSNPDITLRGGATITGTSSNALVVVDGIIRESLSDINPADIESIQVLKDAASTAIYGARANGGVILVETKSGKEGKATVSYKFKMGVNFARYGYDFLNSSSSSFSA